MARALEKHIESTFTQYLELDGWRAFKMEANFSEKKRKGVGEVGMPDHLYVRYHSRHNGKLYPYPDEQQRAFSEVLWIEFKRTRGGKVGTKACTADIRQKDWHAAERARGALTIIVGEDCPATIEGCVQWYEKSGLKRKQSLKLGSMKGVKVA